MTTTEVSSNGHKQTQRRRAVLPFPDVTRNRFRRNSVNSAWTFRKTTSRHDVARTLLQRLIEDYERRNPESFDIDALGVEVIQRTVEQRVQAIPELNEAADERLDGQQQLLRDLAARKPTKVVRQMREVVALTVTDAVTPLRAGLQDIFNRAPFTCLEVIDALQQTLRDLQYPVPDFAPQKRFTHGLRALAVIARAPTLPAKLRERLAAALRKQCVAEFHAAVSALVLDYVCQQLRQAVAELLPYLEELRAQQAAFRRNVEAVRQQLDSERTRARQRSVKSRSSVILEIETPDEIQLLSGIRDQHRCADHGALVLLFADKLHVELNEAARQRYPLVHTPASLTELFTGLPPTAVAAGVASVITGMLGDLHTVFTAVRAFGVALAAQELFDRAAPLCGLSSRDHIRLNVEPHRDLLVRMPQPRGAEDGEIAEQLCAAFRELDPVCRFIEDPSESEISAVRTLVGFPIGIEETNATLLHDYAESAKQGHRPHLYGLLPESPDGRHLPQLLVLAGHTP